MIAKQTLLAVAKMNEAEAREYLESLIWPDGPVCAHCGSQKCGKLNGVKDKKGNVRPGLYKCYACRKQFTATTNTVMHSTHISIQQWLVAFHMMAACKKGVAALELQRVLGIGSYECAHHLAHRIRKAMEQEPLVSKLTGIVESDETWIGGKQRNRKDLSKPAASSKANNNRGCYDNKTPVLAMIERGGNAVVAPIPNAKMDTLHAQLHANVETAAEIHTDEWHPYRKATAAFAGHKRVTHSKREYSRAGVHVNTCESFFGLLKRGIHGTFHQVSRKHLGRYCGEFAFRWNWRKSTDGERAGAIMRGIRGKRLTHSQQVGGE